MQSERTQRSLACTLARARAASLYLLDARVREPATDGEECPKDGKHAVRVVHVQLRSESESERGHGLAAARSGNVARRAGAAGAATGVGSMGAARTIPHRMTSIFVNDPSTMNEVAVTRRCSHSPV